MSVDPVSENSAPISRDDDGAWPRHRVPCHDGERCRTFCQNTPAMLHSIDAQGRLVSVSVRWLDCLGYTAEEVLGHQSVEFLTPQSRRFAEEKGLPAFYRTGSCTDVPYQFVRKDGTIIEVLLSAILERDPEGRPLRSLTAMIDVTTLKLTQEDLNARNLELSTLHQVSTIALTASSPNVAFQEMAEVICLATGFPIVVIELYEESHRTMRFAGATGLPLPQGDLWEIALSRSPSAGVLRSGSPRISCHSDPRDPWSGAIPGTPDIRTILSIPMCLGDRALGALCLAHTDECHPDDRMILLATSLANHLASLSERWRAGEEHTQLANQDPLTGLPNRLAFRNRLAMAIHQAGRAHYHVGVVLLNLDRFRVVNERFGHRTGDRLLRLVADRLLRSIHPGDTVASLGGDEFAILLTELTRPADVGRIAGRICAALRRPFQLNGAEVFISASAGASVHPLDGVEADTLVKHAEMAMSRAKGLGGNTCQVFTSEMNRRAAFRSSLESDMHHALTRGELLLHFQPIRDLRTDRVSGMEALLRWNHPRHGLILPRDFIPLAEEAGLIVPVGLFALRSACRELRALQDVHPHGLRVSVNVSLRQFQQPDLVSRIEAIIRDTRICPNDLDLEFTESVAADHLLSRRRAFRALKALGVRMSLDDFGLGYSSLTQLKRLPIDTVKIDRSFVRTCARDPRDAAIARAIIAMAHSLGLGVVAEGVELDEQLEFLRREGCDRMQGFLFSPALPSAEFRALLARSLAVPERMAA
jgi:diguanylate cyclase (GGDEF)-like protein/PAS domain S-box-containing protein